MVDHKNENENEITTNNQPANFKNTDEQQSLTPADTRRMFLSKFGKLAVVTPIALTGLMTPKTSLAVNSNACKPNPGNGNGGNPHCPKSTKKPKGF